MFERKLLASDLDGTLIQNNAINERDRKAILNFTNEGNVFAIVTGRSYFDFMRVNRYFEIPFQYVVLNGGSLIVDKNHNVIFSKSIGIKELHTSIINALNISKAFKTFIYISYEKSIVNMDYPWNGVFISEDINSICLDLCDESLEVIETVYNILEKSKDYSIVKSGPYIDILPKGFSKEIGILKLLEILEISLNNIATIGNDTNDIPMLKMTTNSFAIISENEQVLSAAKHNVSGIGDCLAIFNSD